MTMQSSHEDRARDSGVLSVFGVHVDLLERDEALARLEVLHDRAAPAFVVYVNPHVVNQAVGDPTYEQTLARAGLRLPDGFGIRIAARRQGRRVPAILNGSDFNVEVLKRCAARAWPVYFLGARPGVAERARENLTARIPELEVVGVHHGYFGSEATNDVTADIRASGASVLMVAMGNPLQENWLAEHLPDTQVSLGLGVGGFLDFSAGTVRRAPPWMNRAGLEWLFRLAMEPRRLARRYIVGNPMFMWRVAVAGRGAYGAEPEPTSR
jgi:exopolysaccharide biosynthesis WecB/TagA/CpsF family protein